MATWKRVAPGEWFRDDGLVARMRRTDSDCRVDVVRVGGTLTQADLEDAASVLEHDSEAHGGNLAR